MGGEASQNQKISERNIAEDYRIVRKVTDSRLGEVTIFQHKTTDELVGFKDLKANSNEEIEQYKDIFGQR